MKIILLVITSVTLYVCLIFSGHNYVHRFLFIGIHGTMHSCNFFKSWNNS